MPLNDNKQEGKYTSAQLTKRVPLPTREAVIKEFTEQSAISKEFFELNCRITENTTEIQQALGWKESKFPHEITNYIALLIYDHQGTLWQAKIWTDKPKPGSKQGNYFAPKGIGDKPYLPKVPQSFCDEVAKQHGLEAPMADEFWQWVIERKEIQIIITEGAKKALACLSAGEVAISIYGCSCGADRKKGLIKEALLPLVESRAKVFLGLDVGDTKEQAKLNVHIAKRALHFALKKADCKFVACLKWDSQYKGLDDLLVADSQGLEKSIKAAKDDTVYQTWRFKHDLSKYNPTIIHQRHFPRDYSFPETAKIICLQGRKSTGKTEAIVSQVEKAKRENQACFVVTHRIKLAQALCQRYGLNHLTDIREIRDSRARLLGFGLCIDSLRPSSAAQFNPKEFENALVIFDEVDEVILHLLTSNTLSKEGNRVEVLVTLKEGIANCLNSQEGRVFLMSADLSQREIEFFKELGDSPETFILVNTFKPIEGKRKLLKYSSPSHFMHCLQEAIESGERVLVHLCSQQAKYKWSTTTTEEKLNQLFPHLRILRIDSESVADIDHAAFNCMSHLDELLAQYDIVICSPTVETGISIDLENHFNSVWQIATGSQSVQAAAQTIDRCRAHIPRHVYVAKLAPGIKLIGNGSTSPKDLLGWQDKLTSGFKESLKSADVASQYSKVGFEKYWADYCAQLNYGYKNYAECYLGLIENEGYEIGLADPISKEDSIAQTELAKAICKELYRQHCEQVANSPTPNEDKLRELERKTTLTKEERQQLEKGQIVGLYLKQDVSPEFVAEHEDGLYNQLDTRYSLYEGRQFVEMKDNERIEKLIYKGKGFSPDIARARRLNKILALEIILKPILEPERIYSKTELREWYLPLLPAKQDIKDRTGVTIPESDKQDMSIRAFSALLGLLGLKLTPIGKEGNSRDKSEVRRYKITQEDWDRYQDIRSSWVLRDTAKYLEENVTSSEHNNSLATVLCDSSFTQSSVAKEEINTNDPPSKDEGIKTNSPTFRIFLDNMLHEVGLGSVVRLKNGIVGKIAEIIDGIGEFMLESGSWVSRSDVAEIVS